MGIDFDWTHDEEEAPFGHDGRRTPRRPGRKGWWSALLIGAVLLVVLAWLFTYRSAITTSPQLNDAVLAHLALEQRAVRTGNSELFFSLQSADPVWRATQLQLVNQRFNAADREVIDIERRGNDVRVTLRVRLDGATLITRMAFYQWHNGVLTRTATDPTFWGERESSDYDWGQLVYHARDRDVAPMIGDLIGKQVEMLCATGCSANRLPLTVTVAPDYESTAAPGHVRVPSPHLLGRSADGASAEPFLAALSARMDDYLAPAVIRFGVPARQFEKYELVAEEFERTHPQIAVEIIELANDGIPAATEWHELDGALFPPPADQIAAGLVLDLTDFAATDPTFQATDFHALALDGAHWRERLWMMPLSAQVPLLLLDSQAYARANLNAGLSPDWDTLQQNVAAIMATVENESLQWGFLDLASDALFAYALGAQCPGTVGGPCPARLDNQAITAALVWYRQMVTETGLAPDITELDHQARVDFAINHQSKPRTIAAWIDLPIYYEHHVQIAQLAIHPLPALNGRQVTPVQITGGFVNAESEHPRTVWTWLSYLSKERPVNQPRALPARTSVTAEIDYWEQLPLALQAPLRTSLQNARPIRLDEQQIFQPDDMRSLLNDEIRPEEVAAQALTIDWFLDDGW